MRPRVLRYGGMKQPAHDQADVRNTTLSIGGMSCGACVRHVTRALEGMTGVVHVAVDLERGEVSVEHLPAFTGARALVAAIRDAGYVARVTASLDDAALLPVAREPVGCACGCCGTLTGRDDASAAVPVRIT